MAASALGTLGLALGAAALVLDQRYPLPLPDARGGTVVTDRDGVPLRTWPSPDGVWRYPVGLADVSPRYLDALLTYEDRWFRWHPGVNPWALARAGWQWLRRGRIVSGGSTLTMQVARLIEPGLQADTRALSTKARQILRALQLEWHLDKDEILTLYLNHAPMGGIVEGVEMASRMWLGKPAAHLTHAEAALLAALPQAPSRLRLDRHPEAARAARDKVLQRMAATGRWPAAAVQDARLENILVPPLRARWLAPLAAERLQREHPGPVVRSTLSAELQSTLERMLEDRVLTLPPQMTMAAMVLDNDTLEVLAHAGTADFANPERAGYVDMSIASRSPGSTLKPFLYALALDDGLVHSESLLVDAPQSFGGYRPGNFQAGFIGPVSVAEALVRSLNVPAVDLLERVGPQRFVARLRNGGLPLRLPAYAQPNLSVILGGAGTTLTELVGAYRALARDGVAGTPRLLAGQPREERRLMSPQAAYIVRDILETGGHPDRPYAGARRGLAWKTGTSFGFRDAWAIGVTERYTLGVWVGRPDGTPNPGFFGANVAAPLLADLAAALPAAGAARAAPPPGVARTTICWPLGLRAADTPPAQCLQRRTAWTIAGTAPPTLADRIGGAPLVQTVWRDAASGLRVTPACARESQATDLATWPVAVRPWLALRGLAQPLAELGWAPDCRPAAQPAAGGLAIQGVADEAVLRPAAGGREVAVRVQAQGGAAPVRWLLDGRTLPAEPASPTLRFARDGRHRLTAIDATGRHQSVAFEVAGTPAPPGAGLP
nr:penicillin-binding protein 1C [Verticiella sediminum]